MATAIRELGEEVGIAMSSEHLAGRLADVVPRTPVLPPIAVRPFVFLPPMRPELVLNPEVASARWVPLNALLQSGAYGAIRLDVAGQSREVQAYRLDDATVWGMTERILTELLGQLRTEGSA